MCHYWTYCVAHDMYISSWCENLSKKKKKEISWD